MKQIMYSRDKRSPKPKSKNVSKVMSGNKAKNTIPELQLRESLCDIGLKYYRLNYKQIPGKPDIVFVSKKIAVFVHGCYWHRCPYCRLPLPKTNQTFWKNKFLRNKQRDKLKSKELKENNWTVMVIWECQVKKNIALQVNKILKLYYA